MTTLSERIRECLEEPPRKTQKALADACGIEAPSVNDWVTGKTKSINAEYLFDAAEFLNVEPKWLGTGKGPKRKNDPVITDDTTDDEDIKREFGLKTKMSVLRAEVHKEVDKIPEKDLAHLKRILATYDGVERRAKPRKQRQNNQNK